MLNYRLKKLFKRFGLDVRLTKNVNNYERITWEDKWRENWRFFQSLDIRTIIDVGANTGQFAQLIHTVFPEAKILSFEPLPACFSVLKQNLAAITGAEAFHCALGADEGTLEINQSDFSPSSSFLEMAALHRQNWPESASGAKVPVRLARLDDMLANRNLEGDILVKIDVQGFEDQVIRGGIEVISRARILLVEVSFVELYAGQPLFHEIYNQLRELGFVYRGNLEQHNSTIDGNILFADAIFVKE